MNNPALDPEKARLILQAIRNTEGAVYDQDYIVTAVRNQIKKRPSRKLGQWNEYECKHCNTGISRPD